MSVSNENQSLKQLIVLGNGFDLACGLKSTYSDFFDYIYGQQMVNNTNSNNFWYKIFQNYKEDTIENWADIEEQILVQLKNIEYLYKEGFLKSEDWIGNQIGYNFPKESLENKSGKSISQSQFNTRVHVFNLLNNNYVCSELKLQKTLKKQLLILEDDFRKYLLSITKNNADDGIYYKYYMKSKVLNKYIQLCNSSESHNSDLVSKLEDTTLYNQYSLVNKFDETLSKIYKEKNSDENLVLTFNYTKVW
ncbi:MAG: AbiH family protein, partial [Lactococcus lactis]|nr:AbiH family protein [Staphylococcus aureus]MDU4038051.1 AbiH family protein [Lactococcus lactis]